MNEYVTIKLRAETRRPLRMLAAATGETIMDLVARLIEQERIAIDRMARKETMNEYEPTADCPYIPADRAG